MANHKPLSKISLRIGEYLRTSRERAGLSLDEASAVLSTSDSESLRRFEMGLEDPPMSEFVRILQAYEVSLNEVRRFIGELDAGPEAP